jgi:hypothetical protein
MKKRLSTKNSLILIATLMVAIVVAVFLFSQKPQPQINSFKDCANAGYPIQESFPERCSVPGGATFTNN